jgi:GTP-binding protein EngB required for normal cell division
MWEREHRDDSGAACLFPGRLDAAARVVREFGLAALEPALRACLALAGEAAPLDVAVLGQFKSGKSSLLNAVLGETVFPVGVVPVTAVITRVAAGTERALRVTYQDGSTEDPDPERLAEFVTEAGNPGNRRHVAAADVFTPAMRDWPGLRLVDTPGLGSVFVHNTEATRAWMPNVGVALVAVSADRPLSDEDRRLVDEARQTAPRVVVLLTKVDLLTEVERDEVIAFLDGALRQRFGTAVPVLPFSSRVEPGRWVGRLREAVLVPVGQDVVGERRAVLGVKLASLVRACRGYLEVGLQAAERADADRQRLRAAVLDESVGAVVIRDELRLAGQRVCERTRRDFEELFLARKAEVGQRVRAGLADALRTWRGNLAEQTAGYERWMAERLAAELTALSADAGPPLANELLGQAEGRLRRVVEAFRDRLGRNIREATGVAVTPLAWEIQRPEMTVVPVAVGRAFMTDWGLLWWLLPMRLVGGLFRRHVLGLVHWEVEKNLRRLAGDWAGAVDEAVGALRAQAAAWVDAELATLDRLLGQRPAEAAAFREALRQLGDADVPQAS